jgi:copper chaperone CopZ
LVEVDLDNDRLQVYYDRAKLTEQNLLQAVDKQGFVATIVAQAPPP